MAINIESHDFIKPKTENVILIDISKEKEEKKLSLVQGYIKKIFELPIKEEKVNYEENEREVHNEEWPNLSRDSQLRNFMTDGTSSLDYSIRTNIGTNKEPIFKYEYKRIIINVDQNININSINKIFKQPKDIKDVLKMNKEIANKKYEATVYKINAKKHYKKLKHHK